MLLRQGGDPDRRVDDREVVRLTETIDLKSRQRTVGARNRR